MRFYVFLIIFIILISIFLISWNIYYIYLQKDSIGQEKIFLVEKGESFLEISKNLEKEGLIKNRFYFALYLILTGNYKKLKTGQYLLSSSITIPEISKKIILGSIIKEKITIIEGWNLRDIGWYLEVRGLFQAEELFELVGFSLIDYAKVTDLPQPKDFSQKFDFLKDKPQNLGLEGYIFPDTYFVEKDILIEEIILKTLDNFGKKLTMDLRDEITKQKKSIFEIVTMASMTEKEVKTLEDKKLVSGILWKRLNNNIPLQVDATIIYITGKRTTKISKEETRINSPYNTYKYQGLPLGPICNPGLESILSSIYPEDSGYWYYLSTPDGETIFSKTLQEHNIAKAKYLK